MRLLRSNRCAFTLIELAVTMVIMAVLTTMGITILTKEVERIRYRNVRLNLSALHSAFQLYRTKYGSFPTGVTWDLDELNTNLGLKINDNDFIYEYRSDMQRVEADRDVSSSDTYWVSVDLITPIYVSNPICASPGLSANCPQLN